VSAGATPPSRPADLAGRVALVTGAGRGLGRAIAVALAAAGADVAAIDLVPPDATCAAIEAGGRRALGLVADVASREAVTAAVARVVDRFGRLDVVVNNAGIAERSELADLDDATLERVLAVIVKGTILVSQAAYPHLTARGGAVVNVASISGMAGGAVSQRASPAGGPGGRTGPAYAAAKGAVIAFTRWLARDGGPHGIRVNAVAPGPVETEMTRGFDYGVERQPLARMGQPEDVAQAVVYLASSMSSFVTGQVLVVDGGLVMH